MTDTIKIAIIGPRSTGKSSLVDYYVNDELPLKDFQSIPLKSTLRILSKEKETKYGHKKIDFFDFGGDATLSQIVTFSPLFDAVAIVIKAGDKSAARDLHAFYSAIATTKVGSKIIVFANRKSLEEHAQEINNLMFDLSLEIPLKDRYKAAQDWWKYGTDRCDIIAKKKKASTTEKQEALIYLAFSIMIDPLGTSQPSKHQGALDLCVEFSQNKNQSTFFPAFFIAAHFLAREGAFAPAQNALHQFLIVTDAEFQEELAKKKGIKKTTQDPLKTEYKCPLYDKLPNISMLRMWTWYLFAHILARNPESDPTHVAIPVRRGMMEISGFDPSSIPNFAQLPPLLLVLARMAQRVGNLD
ncbi:hypothetical protein ADUPG1_000052, partial [Aduncisulcus paluster]